MVGERDGAAGMGDEGHEEGQEEDEEEQQRFNHNV